MKNYSVAYLRKERWDMKVRKTDYYCGAFLSYLISNGVEPMLFDEGKDSKTIRFSVRDKDYKAFVKYSASPRKTRTGTHWDVEFTEKEVNFLEMFPEKDRENIVVIICTTRDFGETIFAVFPQTTAMACLGKDAVNKKRRISVEHKKKCRKLQVYGTAIDQKSPYCVARCCDQYFGFK